MTNQALAVPWAHRACSEPRHRISVIVLAASITALAVIGTAEAKQQCSVAAGSGGYWSWRIIDGRKCWYEGKPMLSKAMLEWPAKTAAQPDADADVASAQPQTRRDPMNAQARELDNPDTFEARWRDRIEGSRR
jgi:hypothetical protein